MSNYAVTHEYDWDTITGFHDSYSNAATAAKEYVASGATNVRIWNLVATAVPSTTIEIVKKGE